MSARIESRRRPASSSDFAQAGRGFDGRSGETISSTDCSSLAEGLELASFSASGAAGNDHEVTEPVDTST